VDGGSGSAEVAGVRLVGDALAVPCVDGTDRPYLSFDAAASTSALPAVAQRVHDFLPWYSSVHRGAGAKSQRATAAYEEARAAVLAHAGRPDTDVAIFVRNTTEAVNHLAHRLAFAPGDVVLTTVVEHHANLLPWRRVARCRYVDVGVEGIFDLAAAAAGLAEEPRPKLLAVTGASNVTGWLPPVDALVDLAHAHGVPVFVDAAQLAPHRPLPAGADYVAWSGHKMYAPYGAGVLVGPRATFASGDPFLAGGGAVELVDLDEVVWTEPPDREEAGSPNVIGAVAVHAALDELARLGWPALVGHESEVGRALRTGLAAIPGVRLLGPGPGRAGGTLAVDPDLDTLAVASFTVESMPHPLVAARLSAEHAIGVRHGCFCAHPYLLRLLDLSPSEVARYRADVLAGDRRDIPGAVRASAGLGTSLADVERLLGALRSVLADDPPVAYEQDPVSGDYHPAIPGWSAPPNRGHDAACALG
jgi:selenocysteine lyase/cysteine desulfurase